MNLKKSCGLWSGLYLLCAAVMGGAVYRRLHDEGSAAGAAFVGGFFLWLGLAYLGAIRSKIAEALRLRRAESGEPPRDGEKIAVGGTVEAIAPLLASPLSGRPCVAYKYEVRHDEATLFEGFALAPSQIQTPRGTMRILACPDLQVPRTDLFRRDVLENFTSYVHKTQWFEPRKVGIAGTLKAMTAPFHDDDGSIRTDARMTDDESQLQHADFTEWTLAPGDRVVATGLYSAQRGGFVPDPDATLEPLVIRDAQSAAGSGSSVTRAVKSVVGSVIGAIICLGIAGAGLLALFAYVPLAAAEQLTPSMNAWWPEIRLERFLERRVRPRMREANLLDSGRYVVDVPRGTARGRVSDGHRDTLVNRARFERSNDVTTVFVNDDLLVLTLDPKLQPLRLRIAGSEVPVDRANLDADMGDKSDEVVLGRLTYFRAGGGPACHVIFKAVQ